MQAEQETDSQHCQSPITTIPTKFIIEVLVICADLARDRRPNGETRSHSLATLGFKEVTCPEGNHQVICVTITRGYTLRHVKVELDLGVVGSELDDLPGEIDRHRLLKERRRCHLDFNGVSNLEAT